MRYSLLLNNAEPAQGEIDEEVMASFQAAFDKYAKSLDEAGVLVSADILGPSSASTTVTLRNGSLQVQDGPFADTKEKLAGAFVIDVPDLDAALAAIQSVHCARAVTGKTAWRALRTLHEALVRIAPTMGARVSLAAMVGEVDGPVAGLEYLDHLDDALARRFQPAWATRAHLLARAGRTGEARRAFDKAISLTTDASMRAWLKECREGLAGSAIVQL